VVGNGNSKNESMIFDPRKYSKLKNHIVIMPLMKPFSLQVSFVEGIHIMSAYYECIFIILQYSTLQTFDNLSIASSIFTIIVLANVVIPIVIFTLHVYMGGTLTTRDVFIVVGLTTVLQIELAKHLSLAVMVCVCVCVRVCFYVYVCVHCSLFGIQCQQHCMSQSLSNYISNSSK
jgi:hypothetical protein